MKTKLHTKNSYNANRTLESVIWISAIVILFLLFSFTATSANPTVFNDESYIDDIPYNTSEIFNEIIEERELARFVFDDEEYIDDIDINIESVATNYIYQKAISVEFCFEEEQFIEDIELQ